MNRRERRANARISQKASSGPGAGTPGALCDAALAHLQAGRLLDAQTCCQQALALDPGHADTLHLLGLTHLQDKQYDFAIEWIARALRQGTPKPIYLWNLGAALHKQGRYEEALKAFDKAVQLQPANAELWKNLAEALIALDRLEEAVLALRQALKLDPRHRAAASRRANLLYRLNRFEEALADNRWAYELNPDDPETCNNTGDVLLGLGRLEEAIEWFDKAIEMKPDLILAHTNKAVALTQLHRFDEAFALYERLNRDGTNTPMGRWNLALLQMLTGHFEAGWAGREARWEAIPPDYPKFSQPKWLGQESIEGKTIVVYSDEGMGDCIQFARYVPMMAARGARVILMVAEPLVPLLSEIPGVFQCFSTGTPPAFDMHCPMCSLPLAFGTRLDSIPSATSYLPPPPEARRRAWEDRLGPHDKLRVGLVWSGNPKHANDRTRSLPLPMLSRILDLDACFVSLQKNPKADDQVFLRERTSVVDLTERLTDFAETAALVSCLDLVITVDTSVAHLAGALGQTTWLLLPHMPDYRWMLDRDDSPWYPTMQLFRQNETRDYGIVLDRVRSELLTLISAK